MESTFLGVKKNIVYIITALIAIILVIYWYYREPMSPVYLDQFAMKYSDPLYFHYYGNKKDILGMSRRDYYLEHDMLSKSGAESYDDNPGDTQFENTTNYMAMNKTYRPTSQIKNVVFDHE